MYFPATETVPVLTDTMVTFGENIKDYQVLNLLGRGGFAAVYRALCLRTGQEVAIKMIDKELMQKANAIDRVRQEVSIHRRLDHPSILKLYAFFEDAKKVYLILKLCPNGELLSYLKEHPQGLCEREASHFFKQIVEGVHYLHSHQILHRDLSLANLLLTEDMHVKIADFGLATQLSRPDEKHMTMCGTPNFISPEVASRGSHGLEVDVWGLGCLLYTMLVGSAPFTAQAVRGTLTRVVIDRYDVPDHLSAEAKDLIASLLQKNPHDRIKSDQILTHPFIKQHCVLSRLNYPSIQDSGVHTMSSNRDTDGSNSCIPSYRFGNHSSANSCPSFHQQYSGNGFNPTSSGCMTENRRDPGGGQSSSRSWNLVSNPHRSCNSNTAAPTYHSGNINVSSKSETPSVRRHEKELRQLTAYRLRPHRLVSKKSILSILDTGEVCIEFLQKRGKDVVVSEVCRISTDGLRFVLYRPEGKRTIPGDRPPPLPSEGTDHIYGFESLPEKHWKKYVYATEFVDLIKGKTAKITHYTDKAKVVLMESIVHFEVQFYDGGNVSNGPKEGVTLTSKDGGRITLKSVEECRNLTAPFSLMWSRSQEMYNHCMLIENTLGQLPGSNFPVVIGRKPLPTPLGANKENVIPASRTSSFKTSLSAPMNPKEKQITVPGVGIATQFANKEIRIKFSDGSELCIDGKTSVKYQYPNGRIVNYRDDDQMPAEVMEKMSSVPKVMKHFQPVQTVPQVRSLR